MRLYFYGTLVFTESVRQEIRQGLDNVLPSRKNKNIRETCLKSLKEMDLSTK